MSKKLTFLLLGVGVVALLAAPASARTLDIQISAGADDMEERTATNLPDDGSSDLEMPYENAGTDIGTQPQVVGLRFAVPLPKGAVISKAYVEFTVDEAKGGTQPVNLVIDGQLVPNAPAFTSAVKDVSGRAPRTAALVKWTASTYEIPAGKGAGDPISSLGMKVQTADLTAILSEIINQDGWASGNGLVLIFADDPNNPSTGVRCFDAVENGATVAPLLHIEAFVGKATDPSPANGATGVTMPVLQWAAGDTAVAHNLYAGAGPELTAANLVSSAQSATMYYYALAIEPGATYYWRVDEVDAAGAVIPGDVWSFTIQPLTAWAPSPADNAKDLAPSQTLNWSAGQFAVEHHVFFGGNQADVAAGAAAADKGKMAETKLATGPLALKTTYYWRVDEVQGNGTAISGPVWSFTTASALDLRIASGTDDAEEHLIENPRMDLTSSDLEMPYEDWNSTTSLATDEQLIGMRWQVPVAKGTLVTNAYIEFILSEAKGNMNPVNVILEGQLIPDALAFTATALDITSRARTAAQVKWTIPTGLAVGDKFHTPDVSPILNELLAQEGWISGNGLVVMVRDDKGNPSTGIRNAESFNTASGTRAPLLHIEVP